jgi:hypothetical protein
LTVTDPARGEAWSLAFARRDGTGGFVRLLRWPDRAWYWTYLVSPTWGLVVVRDHEVAPPRGDGRLVVRGDALWAELAPESPTEHGTVAVEAFGVRLDDPLDAERGERGERLPVGLDLEWEVGAGPYGTVHGDLLLGDERAGFEGTGTCARDELAGDPWAREWRRLTWQRDGSTGRTARDGEVALGRDPNGLPTTASVDDVGFSVAAVAVVPLRARLVLALLRGDAGCGWLEWCQPDRDLGRLDDR